MNRLIQHLRVGLPDFDGSDTTDGQLLENYLTRREEAPFAALVRRHGPMVWGVCRRVLHTPQDAEDAFQATFLVLVRKAASIVPRQMVGNWLYGVAYQTAVKARAIAARRHMRERQVTDMPEPPAMSPDHWPELQAVLDQELTRLPDKYRAVVLLCDVEGKTRKEAARQLAVPEGTIAGRLARARAILAKRLTRRGVTLSGGSLAAILVQYAATANVPAAVVSSTIYAATLFAAGPVPAGAIPPPVVTLTEGVLKSMLLTKLKIGLAVVIATGLLGIGVSGIAFRASAAGDAQQKGSGGPPDRSGKHAGNPEAELRQLRAEVDKLRTEVDELKKHLRPADGKGPAVVQAAESDKPKLTIRVFPVKDLIGAVAPDDQSPPLIRIIMSVVEPTTWQREGGPGSVEYFAAGQSLVVSQTADVHEKVEALLEALLKAKIETDSRLKTTGADRKK
ncbi:MAG TPA: RNA polymerase sigma factor [Gemmataceae bacterium]|nr:RNA polymerase sigma factor [Gemmataceae bacterium]